MNITRKLLCVVSRKAPFVPTNSLSKTLPTVCWASPLRSLQALLRDYSTQNVTSASDTVTAEQWQHYLTATDAETEGILGKDMLVYPNFLSEAEEQSLLSEVEPYMKRLRYEFDHWDNVREFMWCIFQFWVWVCVLNLISIHCSWF